MVEVVFNDELSFALPENWSELIAAGHYLKTVKHLTEPDRSTAAFNIFFEITGADGKQLGAMMGAATPAQRAAAADNLNLATAIALHDALEVLDFIFDTPFTQNPIPSFTHKGVTYYGPSDRLSSQKGEEWLISYHAGTQYSETGERKHLVNMLAANYHSLPGNAFIESAGASTFSRDSKNLQDVQDELLHGFALWYRHADAWWYDKYKWMASDRSAEVKQKSTGLEIRHMLFMLAGNAIGSDWDIIKTRSRQDIMITLDRLAELKEEQEALMKS